MRLIDTWFGEVPQRERRAQVVQSDPVAYSGPPTPEVNPVARWVIGFAGASCKPYAILHCTCKVDTTFELPGNGWEPKPKCCVNAPAYPRDEKHQKHLWKTGTWPDGTFQGTKAPAGVDPEVPPASGVVTDQPYRARRDGLSASEQGQLDRQINADIESLKKQQR